MNGRGKYGCWHRRQQTEDGRCWALIATAVGHCVTACRYACVPLLCDDMLIRPDMAGLEYNDGIRQAPHYEVVLIAGNSFLWFLHCDSATEQD